MNVVYTSSNGKTFELTASMRMRLKDARFHTFAWQAEMTEKRFGSRVDKWKKESAVYPASFVFRGSAQERRQMLDAFHTAIERDMFYNSPGRLTWGDWYISCFIQSSETYPSEGSDTDTINDVEILCPSSLWISEQTIHIGPTNQIILRDTDKRYDPSYGYPYSYQANSGLSKMICIDHYAPCDFRAVLHGPQANVNITIGNVSLQVSHAIPESGYMVIDTREEIPADKHCYLVAGGVETNCFNDRNPECTLLDRVEPGNITVTYNRHSELDLTIYRRRGEPTWN